MVPRDQPPLMESEPIQPAGASRALQGCLFGAVLLFVILLVVMLVLAYTRMREMTAPDAAPVPSIQALVGPGFPAGPPPAPR